MQKFTVLFLLFAFITSCEQKIPDTEPLFSHQTLDAGAVQFKASAKNATAFEWDFGDGNKSSQPNPVNAYVKNGEYSVVLIAKNKRSQVTKIQRILVANAPKPAVKFSYKSQGEGLVQFVNETPGADAYRWIFGDGNVSTDKSPTHQYVTNGTYSVKLEATNYNGTAEYSHNVTIADAPKPVADFSSRPGDNGAITFTNASRNATSYQWSFGNGQTATTVNPTTTYAANGTYSVTLTARNANGENTVVKTVRVDNVYTPTTGSVVFWSRISDKGNLKIWVNGTYRGLVSVYYPTGRPNCGDQGNVTVTLPQGAYTFRAESEGWFPSKWEGVINVTNGQCRSMELTSR